MAINADAVGETTSPLHCGAIIVRECLRRAHNAE
jgi:hypothetical protein